jgi:hypothetical protein
MLRGLGLRGLRMSHGADPEQATNRNRTYMTDRTYMVPVSTLRDKRHGSGPYSSDT